MRGGSITNRNTQGQGYIRKVKITGPNFIPMHIYPSQVVHMHKSATLASIAWTQECPQESQGQGHGSYASCIVHRHKLATLASNTLNTGGSTRIPRSTSWLQGRRSQDQNSMPMCIDPSWVVHRHRLATLESISWTQGRPQESQVQCHGSKVKGHRTKIPCACTSTPHG